ncbi:MAG: DUF3892 domain-containing protein [Oscillospiraceae bacterium]|nr:DUF3892 domain-containing protein [Oscillospiraceae bacterium]
MQKKTVRVTKESDTGRNIKFKDIATGREKTRPQFVKEIEQGKYPNYHIRKIDGIKTPVSNPDGKEYNNLG